MADDAAAVKAVYEAVAAALAAPCAGIATEPSVVDIIVQL